VHAVVSDAKELRMRLEVQQARVAELLEQASHWRGRATAAESRVDATELALQRAQRLQTTAELDAREARKQAAAANDAAGLAQRTIADLEHRVRTHTHTHTHTHTDTHRRVWLFRVPGAH
jgi:IMP cyclohydrolase